MQKANSNLTLFTWSFVKRQKTLFFFILITSFMWGLDATLWPYILRYVINVLVAHEGARSSAWTALMPAIYSGIGLWAFLEFNFRLQGWLLAKALPKLEADMRMTMFDHVQQHSPKYFNDRFAGSLANKITDMTTQISNILQQYIHSFIPALVGCILAVVFFFYVNSLFALILGGWVILHFTICLVFTKKCDQLETIHGESRSLLLGKIVDSLTNNFAVNLFYRFKYEKLWIGRFQRIEEATNEHVKKYVELVRVFIGLTTFIIGCLVMNGLILYLWSKGKISTGEVIQIFNTTWSITMIMWFAGFEIPRLFQSIGVSKQALIIMQDPQDLADKPDAKPLLINKGQIIFDNVSFYYGDKQLFQNKNVTIRGGEKVGLVGFSGSGKSTFVNLILRFYGIKKGRILIDGQDISHVSLESLRRQVALIPQDPILFHRSLEDNIRYGNTEASKEEVIQAAILAHCDEFIRRCPKGYDTLVGERGTKLSGGERQRIAIARAMLTKAPILILDEATSALDSINERYIQESLESLMENRTTIVIAHRLSTLAKMDRILVLDKGKIVEEGTHLELLNKKGHYSHLWSMQAGGFLPDSPEA